MEIHRPKINQLPFACALTFSGGGGKFGDIVQVNIHNLVTKKVYAFLPYYIMYINVHLVVFPY